MIAFDHVQQRLKRLLKHRYGKTKILDKELAQALGLDPQYFAVIKRRNKIPYEAIADFCRIEHVSLNWVLFGQSQPYLTSTSNLSYNMGHSIKKEKNHEQA